VAESVPPLRRALRRLARRHGASAAVQARVSLAFSEACILLVEHGRDAPREGMLIVEARASAEALEIRVSDSGRGVRPRLGLDGQGLEIALMTQTCDRLAIEHRRIGSGMAVTMTFELQPERQVADPRRARLAAAS